MNTWCTVCTWSCRVCRTKIIKCLWTDHCPEAQAEMYCLSRQLINWFIIWHSKHVSEGWDERLGVPEKEWEQRTSEFFWPNLMRAWDSMKVRRACCCRTSAMAWHPERYPGLEYSWRQRRAFARSYYSEQTPARCWNNSRSEKCTPRVYVDPEFRSALELLAEEGFVSKLGFAGREVCRSLGMS